MAALVAAGFLMSACSDEEPKLEDGARCADDRECEGGACVSLPDLLFSFCSSPCAAAIECRITAYHRMPVCRENGFCGPPCYGLSYIPAGYVCREGLLATCESLAPVDGCARCGCEIYGGGACVEGRGCVLPMPDGAVCTIDEECVGYCNSDTHNCRAAFEFGAACGRDSECASRNCSTDGGAGFLGRCNVALGSTCTRMDCTDCIDTFVGSYCSRARCGPTARCPEGFECLEATDGVMRCYEACRSTTDSCIDPRDSCTPPYCF